MKSFAVCSPKRTNLTLVSTCTLLMISALSLVAFIIRANWLFSAVGLDPQVSNAHQSWPMSWGTRLTFLMSSDKDTTNLMSRGGANPTQMLATYLNTEQIETARKQARTRRPAGIIRQLDFLWKRNDKNGDDVITIDEANPVVKRYFNTFDDDADGVVDRIEFDQNAVQYPSSTRKMNLTLVSGWDLSARR